MRKFLLSFLLAMFLTASLAFAEEVLDVSLVIDNGKTDGSILLVDDEPSSYSGSSGDYELKILDSNKNVLWSQSFELSYMYNQSLNNLPFDMLGYRTPYNSNMFELRLYKKGDSVFSKQLTFCDEDGVCDYDSESDYSCPEDCAPASSRVLSMASPASSTDGVVTFDKTLSKDPSIYFIESVEHDGNYLWAAEPSYKSGVKVFKVDDDTGSVVDSYLQRHYTVGVSNVIGLAYDHVHNDIFNHVFPYGPIYVVDANPPYSEIRSFSAPRSWIHDIAFDGTYLWGVDGLSPGSIYKISATTGSLLARADAPVASGNPIGVTFDGQYLWINRGGYLFQIDQNKAITDGHSENAILQKYSMPIGGRLAWDGSQLWTQDSTHFYRIKLPELPKISLSAVWKDEEDRMVVPSDKVNLEFTLKNKMSGTIHNVVLNFQSNVNYVSLEQSSVNLGDVSPGQEKSAINAMLIAGVENSQIYTDIIQNNQQIPLSNIIKVTVTYDTKSLMQDVTPTDGTGSTLKIQYPDFSSIVGNDPTATQQEKEFYLSGDSAYHHPNNNLVRKYSVKAATYKGENTYEFFPDTPNLIANNLFEYVNELLDPKHHPDNLHDDTLLLSWVENGLLDIDKQYVPYPQYNKGHMCIEHAYLLTSLTKTLGLPSRELTSALGTGVNLCLLGLCIVYGDQEAATQIWYDNKWNFYDPYMYYLTSTDKYLQRWISYRSWYDFSKQPENRHYFAIYESTGEPTKLYQWKHLKSNFNVGLLFLPFSPINISLTDELGRVTGSTTEGTFEEIPGSIYIPQGRLGFTDASDPTSIVELNQSLFIPFEVGEYYLDAIGTETGAYTLISASLGAEEEITIISEYTSEIVEGQTDTFKVDISLTPEGIPVVEVEPISPKLLKEDSIPKLESVKTDCVYKWWQWWKWLLDKKCKQNKIIDHVIGKIEDSLNPRLWVDDWHLSDKHDEKVFMDEHEAIKYMMAKKKLVSEEVKIVFEEVTTNLVKADNLLAHTIIDDAKNTPVIDPKNQEKVNRELMDAEDEFYKAEQSVAQGKFDKAILHYKKAWEHAQLAIKFAKKEKEKCWLWWKCKEKRGEEKEEKISVIDAWGRLLEKVGGGYTKR